MTRNCLEALASDAPLISGSRQSVFFVAMRSDDNRLPGFWLGLTISLLSMALAPFFAGAQTSSVALSPAVVAAGSPVLIHVDAGREAAVDGDWLGRTIQFFPAARGDGWVE